MEIALKPEQQAMIRDLVEAGRYATCEEAVADAVALLVERERSEHDELQKALDIGFAELASGNYVDVAVEDLPAFMREIAREAALERRCEEGQKDK